MNRMHTILLASLLTLAPAALPAQESLGVSRADLPGNKGAFSIENATGVTISYKVKWGNSSDWKPITLQNGHTETHSHSLAGNGTAPTPYVRFDRVGGDGRFTPQEYRMQFAAVGYSGFGAARSASRPKPYYFLYGPDHRSLDLKSR